MADGGMTGMARAMWVFAGMAFGTAIDHAFEVDYGDHAKWHVLLQCVSVAWFTFLAIWNERRVKDG
jgi:hypothetical protein